MKIQTKKQRKNDVQGFRNMLAITLDGEREEWDFGADGDHIMSHIEGIKDNEISIHFQSVESDDETDEPLRTKTFKIKIS